MGLRDDSSNDKVGGVYDEWHRRGAWQPEVSKVLETLERIEELIQAWEEAGRRCDAVADFWRQEHRRLCQ